MAKIAKLVAKFQREPVQILRYDRAARGRTALCGVILVERKDLHNFLSDAATQDALNVKATV